MFITCTSTLLWMTQLYFSIGSHLGAPIVPPEAYGQLLPYTDLACKENTQPLSLIV